MADNHVNSISLKALVDKANNRIIFVESDEDFIDILFSFLTMPMGNILRLTRNQPPSEEIGCMNNLYKSVEDLDVKRLQTEACKSMLLSPRSVAETHCNRLKLKFDDGEPTRYFLCSSSECTASKLLLSHHMGARCDCGNTMSREITLSNKVSEKLLSTIQDRGVFAKGLTHLLVTDDLQVIPPSTLKSLSILSKFGVMDGSNIEERTLDVEVDKILTLLKCSFVSKIPLTETFLKDKPADSTTKIEIHPGLSSISQLLDVSGKMEVNIMYSRTKKVVCYAEAGEDFVDLLFSFLTIPLGYMVKEMRGTGSSSKGCIDHLYASVQDLDAKRYIKSDEHKAMLVNPKVAPGFRHEKQLLGIEEASHPLYQLRQCLLNGTYVQDISTSTDEIVIGQSGKPGTLLTAMDPKSQYKDGEKGGVFVKGPAMYTVTDNLVIRPVSPVTGISFLNKGKTPIRDVVAFSVTVGAEEATRLLVASLLSESALTNTFIRKGPIKIE